MSHTTFTLTDLELACSVTLADVARELPRAMIRENGATVIIDGTLAPALGNAVARCAFGSHPYKYAGMNRDLGLAIYRATDENGNLV